MRKYISNENIKIISYAVIGTVLAFMIFAGQACFSDVVTFAKGGDADKLCYAAFMKIRECFVNGESLVGVDSGSFNGSTEFFLRPNIPSAYVWFYLFAFLATIFQARAVYLLFYAIHMFMGLVYIQKLAMKYFRLDSNMARVVASMYLYLLCTEAWYLSFYIITSLSVVLMYMSLDYFYEGGIKRFILLILVVEMGLTSGYITVSCFLVGWVFLLCFMYVCLDKKCRNFKNILKFVVPYMGGGLITVPYMLEVFIYAKKIVRPETTLADAVFYKLNLNDILSVISSFSFTTSSSVENLISISLGFVAIIMIMIAVADDVMSRIECPMKVFIRFNMIAWVCFIIWVTESSTAFTGWMYSILPIFGAMHIPSRYMMVTLPFFYMSICMLIQNIRWKIYSRWLKVGVAGCLCIGLIYIVTVKMGNSIPFVNENGFIIELFITCVVLAYLSKINDQNINQILKHVSLIWCFMLILSGVTVLDNVNEVYKRKSEVENSSIIYNRSAIESIDNFIFATSDQKKDMYRIVSFDSQESVPKYLLSNYEWYNYSTYSLCNYSGYEIHLATPVEYRQMSSWFNIYDWNYLLDTRADYMLTDYETINANREFYDGIINWSKGSADIGNGRVMVALYHFIPSMICDTQYVHDEVSLDNGYFYSHDLTNENVFSFKTNENSYFEIGIESKENSVINFLPYANRCFKYYIDNVEYKPEIINMQALLEITPGKHIVTIVYKNIIGGLGLYTILFMGLLLSLIVLGVEIREIYVNNFRKKV